MATAQDKLNWIHERLNEGKTVYISTAYKATALKAKHKDAVKVKGDSLYLQRGKRWDCADYCKISAA